MMYRARMRGRALFPSVFLLAAVPAPLAAAPASPTRVAEVGTLATGALPSGDGEEVRARLEGWNAPLSPRGVAADPLGAPVDLGRLSSGFGPRVDPLLSTRRRHEGIDIAAAIGTPVHAAADGVVGYARRAGGYGNLVELNHGAGLETRYAHLSRIDVLPGVAVHRGDVLGLMGSTGRSTGSHLHFEVRVDGRPADPLVELDRVSSPPPPAAPPVTPHWTGWDGLAADHLPGAQLK